MVFVAPDVYALDGNNDYLNKWLFGHFSVNQFKNFASIIYSSTPISNGRMEPPGLGSILVQCFKGDGGAFVALGTHSFAEYGPNITITIWNDNNGYLELDAGIWKDDRYIAPIYDPGGIDVAPELYQIISDAKETVNFGSPFVSLSANAADAKVAFKKLKSLCPDVF